MSPDEATRRQLVNLLTMPQAHMTFDHAVEDFPAAHYNTRPPGLDYSFWHLLEHMRICQWDILDYCVNPHYTERLWPAGYWPAPEATCEAAGWQETIRRFHADLNTVVALVNNPATDLYAPIPHGYEGHTILREILVVADHNAYHIGEFGILRQTLGLW